MTVSAPLSDRIGAVVAIDPHVLGHRVRRPAGGRGGSWAPRPMPSPRPWPSPGPRSASCCAIDPHRSACSSACSERVVVRWRSIPIGESSAPGLTRSARPAVRRRRARGRDRLVPRTARCRPGSPTEDLGAASPSTRGTAVTRESSRVGDRGAHADERHDRATQTHRSVVRDARSRAGRRQALRSQAATPHCASARPLRS